jgi:hypothetical protein
MKVEIESVLKAMVSASCSGEQVAAVARDLLREHQPTPAPSPDARVVVVSAKKLGGLVAKREARQIDASGPIFREVMEKHRVTRAELVGDCRDHRLVRARRELYSRLKSELGMSYPAIGQLCNRDHTTVLHSLRNHRKRQKVLARARERHKNGAVDNSSEAANGACYHA